MKSITNIEFKNKTVLVRVDLNIPLQDGKVTDYARIHAIKATIDKLADNNTVAIISHFGRPNGFEKKYSLEFLVPILADVLKRKVHFIPGLIHSKTEIGNNKGIILLDNIRFNKGEEENDENLAQQLAALADVYVNDAFSCSHRAHASISAITKFLPSYAGIHMTNEIHNLERIYSPTLSPKIAIIGGSKISTKFKVLKSLAVKMDKIIIGGAMTNTFLSAQGHAVGASLYEKEFVREAKILLASGKFYIPVDVVTAKKDVHATKATPIKHIEDDDIIYDIGPNSTTDIMTIIDNAKLVLWNGPMGMFEDPRFATSSEQIARKIAVSNYNAGLTCIAGGGDTLALLEKTGLTKEFTYVSTAGGAFLDWLEDGELPGIKALKEIS